MDATALAALLHMVTEVYHLAAVYALAMPRALGMQVNVHGTQHVLDFARRLTNLRCGFDA
jgi:nucleoside-diphosphate-sugar epimerase